MEKIDPIDLSENMQNTHGRDVYNYYFNSLVKKINEIVDVVNSSDLDIESSKYNYKCSECGIVREFFNNQGEFVSCGSGMCNGLCYLRERNNKE